ncbi:MAG: hypothetical protein DSZ07_08095 [Sulfurovum sp.]|nr:MAG: hypothetical protein DSZ07_08095 [Sulfurovum sp.]
MKRILLTLLPLLLQTAHAQEIQLKSNSWGVEVNPIRLLQTSGDYFGFSGTISHFDNTNGVEIAMPIYYTREDKRFRVDNNQHFGAVESRLNLDLHYRRYLSFSRGLTESLYVGAFTRYTHLNGEAIDREGTVVVNKLGFGGEVGMKTKNLFNTPFYWGCSLMIGGYVTGNNDKLSRDVMFDAGFDDRQLIVDIELLKIGYEF